MSETEMFFQSNLLTENAPPQKKKQKQTTLPPPPQPPTHPFQGKWAVPKYNS